VLNTFTIFNWFFLQVNQIQSSKYRVDKYLHLYLTIIGRAAFQHLYLFTLYVFYDLHIFSVSSCACMLVHVSLVHVCVF